MNMRGVFLHVLGDALGSVVVIISALFIWLTDYEWRHYVDPAMSLIIVAIITGTTVPLCKLNSYPLFTHRRPIKMKIQRVLPNTRHSSEFVLQGEKSFNMKNLDVCLIFFSVTRPCIKLNLSQVGCLMYILTQRK